MPVLNIRLDRSSLLRDAGSPAGFYWLIGGYVVLHCLLRLLFDPVLGTDDVEQAVYAQTLQWGYDLKQPPLYTWLQWGMDRIVGVGVHSHALLKYLLLFLTYFFLYRCGRLLFAGRMTPLLASAGLWLTYPLAVSIHQGVTHTILLCALLAASLYAFLRLERQTTPAGYLGLGLLLGLGLISKYSFAIFAAGLALAALTVPRFRRVLLNRLTLAGLLMAALVVAPHALWAWERHQEVGAALAGLGGTGPADPGLGQRLGMLLSLASAAVQFLAPLWLVLLAVYPRAFGRLPGVHQDDSRRLLGRVMAISLALLAGAILMGKIGEIKPRWMHATLLVFPLYFFLRAEAAYPDGVVKKGYLASLALLPVLVIGVWAAQTYLAPGLGRPSRFHVPYDLVAARLRLETPAPATILAGDEYLAGNLRLGFPAARVINARYPSYRPGPRRDGPCLVAWETGPSGTPDDIATLLGNGRALGTGPEIRRLQEPYRHADSKVLEIRYLMASPKDCP